jgi:hypothetical protein
MLSIRTIYAATVVALAVLAIPVQGSAMSKCSRDKDKACPEGYYYDDNDEEEADCGCDGNQTNNSGVKHPSFAVRPKEELPAKAETPKVAPAAKVAPKTAPKAAPRASAPTGVHRKGAAKKAMGL